MQMTRTENLINNLAAFIAECKPATLSRSNISADRDTLFALVDDIKQSLPEDLERCTKVIAQKENILAKAREEAAKIIQAGKERAEQLVCETAIVQTSYARANDIISEADRRAKEIISEAERTRDIINNGVFEDAKEKFSIIIESYSKAFQETRDGYDNLMRILQDNLADAEEHRRQLMESFSASEENIRRDDIIASMSESGEEQDYTEEDF